MPVSRKAKLLLLSSGVIAVVCGIIAIITPYNKSSTPTMENLSVPMLGMIEPTLLDGTVCLPGTSCNSCENPFTAYCGTKPKPKSQSYYCPEDNCIKFQGHPFGFGFHKYDELQINKSIDDVINKCVPKCVNDKICTGFGFRINDRYDGRPNGNCWFMKGEFKYVDSKPFPNHGGGVWIKELDPNSDYEGNTLIWKNLKKALEVPSMQS